MFHALALAASVYTTQSGNTLSGIAASNGVSLSQLEAANPQIGNPNLIYIGESINLSGGGSASAPAESSPSPSSVSTDTSGDSSAIVSGDSSSSGSSQSSAPAPSDGSSSGGSSSGGSGGYNIPGMSSSMANCIAYRESTNGTNPAAGGNVFGIIPASGYNVSGDSLAQQEQVAGQIYANSGGGAWQADGCPGT